MKKKRSALAVGKVSRGLFLLLLCSVVSSGWAQVPQTTSYQGVLTDESGNAVADGTYKLDFELHTTQNNGAIAWQETHENVPVISGIFNVILGSINALDIPFDEPYFLAISVNDGQPLQPFTPLTSTPYSLGVADSVVTASKLAGNTAVRSINSLTDRVSLVAGDNVTITAEDTSLVISAQANGQNGGDITAVTAGEGLTGGGESGNVELAIADAGITSQKIADDVVVKEINGLKDAITLSGAGGATVTTRNDSIIINAGSGNGGTGIQGVQNTNNSLDIINPNGPTATINVKDGGIQEEHLADDAVTGDKIANGQVLRSLRIGPIENSFQFLTDSVNLNFGANMQLGAEGGPDGGAYVIGAVADGNSLDSPDRSQRNVLIVNDEGNVGIGTEKIIGSIEADQKLTVDGIIKSVTGGFQFPDGTVQTTASSGAGNAWQLGGNEGTTAETDFLGTTDDEPFEIRVNQTRALRLELIDLEEASTFNFIGGKGSVSNEVHGATISGGGAAIDPNTVNGDYGTIAGGLSNLAGAHSAVGGGNRNIASGNWAVIAGGQQSSASGEHATISGGGFNQASDNYATVGGGESNIASDIHATVSGGGENEATETYATVGGGDGNRATGSRATVSGGGFNEASANYATVAGGQNNKATFFGGTVSGGINNSALRNGDTIGGGFDNVADGSENSPATVGGGQENQAVGLYATIAGGRSNTASDSYATIGGGTRNIASGQRATVPGGEHNHARGRHSLAAGYKARAIHEGSFVWNDRSVTLGNDSLVTTADNQFLIRAQGGVGIGTNRPRFPLEMASGAHVTAGGVWTNASSRAYKENIADLGESEALAVLKQLNPVKYNYRTEQDEDYLGFIAEDVPELVATQDRKSLSPMDIVALLTKVVQAQQAMISKLQQEVAGLNQQRK